MNLQGKKIVVIGMGRTGIATAAFLGLRGARVAVTDEKPREAWDERFARIAREKWLEIGSYDAEILNGADMVIPSPGVPPYNDILAEAVRKKVPVMSEIELAYRFLKKPMIAVTGTNGKTTATSLLGEILAGAGKRVFVGGNIGNPLIEFAGTAQNEDFVVAEISSFQLQWVEKFHPFIAILLNVTCDHVDYHGSFEAYRSIKALIFANQNAADYAILNAEDAEQKSMAPHIGAKIALFSSAKEIQRGMHLRGDDLIFKSFDGSEEMYPRSMIKLPGLHNVENIMAAVMAARFCGCGRESIVNAVAGFRGLPHRIEYAGEKKGVKFYDDSKGTNVGSVVRALDTFTEPVILLLGGRDKDGDFDTLQPLLTKKTKKVILFGEARERIAAMIGPEVPAEKRRTLREAVESAYQNAAEGDIVLLSPGCASFDEFKNYKERGDFFKNMIGNL
ncbi:MAG TPA: UDP-N-acetylmuramoyl-L-alanine--D-glutamate ligase [Smithellaceae bacterium]|nr:UDP-N-acetylmuramoyl-L-alanine--D-glutamate ligase [Smithellaceae bacterium]